MGISNHFDSEESYSAYIKLRKWAKSNRGKKCPSKPGSDWTALGDDKFPTSEHAIFFCTVCDAEFPWIAGKDHRVPLGCSDEPELIGSCEGPGLEIPWWGWPIVIATLPLAIPVALTVVVGEAMCSWWRGDDRCN